MELEHQLETRFSDAEIEQDILLGAPGVGQGNGGGRAAPCWRDGAAADFLAATAPPDRAITAPSSATPGPANANRVGVLSARAT